MKININLKTVGTILLATILSGGLAGCVEEKSLNTDTVEYTPEERPLGVIAGEGAEYEPGAQVTLQGQLVGTVNGQTVLWSQKSGTPIEGIEDWTQPTISFVAPIIIGIEAFVFEIAALESDGTPVIGDDGNPLVDETSVTVFDPATKIFYEIEDVTYAELKGVEIATAGHDHYISGASGDKHTADMTPGATVEYTINSEEDKFVTLYASFASPYDSKGAKITVNGVEFELMIPTTSGFNEYRMGVIKLNAGENSIVVGGGWDYYRVDYIMTVPAAPPAGPIAVVTELVNDNASQEAKDLMLFLQENYGTATLSGQTEFPRKEGNAFPLTEYNKIVTATGDDAPAIVAFDFMNYSSSHTGNDFDGLTESIITEHNEKNIIVSTLHHWRAPSGNHNSEGAFYTNATDFDLAAALADTSSAEYAELITDIDIIAVELQKLEDAGIPVLWRPLHEAEGGWFWWGAAGPDALKELWVIMYDRMTNTHGLDNLIWVYTHTSSLSEDWYPGDAYVDIVGFDGYADPRNDESATFTGQYATLKNRHDGQKLVALTETGTIPTVTTMHEQNAWWSFFITWNSQTWNPDSVIGPQGANPADIDANYAGEGVINLADIPGGRDKVEAGIYENFDISTAGFEGQINWSPQPGLAVTDGWAASGAHALTYLKDLSLEVGANGVILQTYPVGGIDVTDVTTLSVSANAINAGPNVTIKLWAKDADGVWRDAGAVPLEEGGLDLSIDVSDIDTVSGFGLQIGGFDATSTAGEFYLDNVRLDGDVLHDFEPDTSGFAGQINWGNQPGMTVTHDWATNGVRALTYVKDLSMEEGANGVIMQTYPEGGIDVTGVSLLKLSANAANVGDATTIKLWAKDGDGAWRDAGAALLEAGGLELEIDVSDLDVLQGFGLQIENFDASATNAKFYLDNVRLDDAVLYDFEGTGKWEFQVNWSPVEGVQLAKDWVVDGGNSLSGVTQLVDGDDNVILQVYPEGGLVLGDVTTLKVTASIKDAGDAVQVQLFAKDMGGAWRDGGAVDMVDGVFELSLDIADLTEMSGFGVRFMGPNNTESNAQFYIDKVEFE